MNNDQLVFFLYSYENIKLPTLQTYQRMFQFVNYIRKGHILLFITLFCGLAYYFAS